MKEIYDYLKRQEICPGHSGFQYLAYVIDYAVKNPGAKLNDCYAYAAVKCNTSSGKISGGIRYALSSSQIAYEKKPKEFINEAVLTLKNDI